MLNFDGKVVFITGGNSGIGKAAVQLFIKRGAKVIATDISFPSCEPNRINFEKNPVEIYLDVKNSREVSIILDLTVKKNKSIDIVVNSAGIVNTTPFLDITERDWDEIFAVNVKGTLFVCQQALKHMLKRNAGCFVNISSISGKVGGVTAGADYSASKAAVTCLTKSLAKAGAPHGIRANSVAPAAIRTPILDQYDEKSPGWEEKSIATKPLKRLGTALEVANTILFLASDEASYITGESVDVDGGMLMD